jgi:hypothetical protein
MLEIMAILDLATNQKKIRLPERYNEYELHLPWINKILFAKYAFLLKLRKITSVGSSIVARKDGCSDYIFFHLQTTKYYQSTKTFFFSRSSQYPPLHIEIDRFSRLLPSTLLLYWERKKIYATRLDQLRKKNTPLSECKYKSSQGHDFFEGKMDCFTYRSGKRWHHHLRWRRWTASLKPSIKKQQQKQQ